MRVPGIACAVFAAALSLRAVAQVPLPSPADPGRIEERISPQRPTERTPELPQLRGLQPPRESEDLRAVRFTLKEVKIEGATAGDAADLLQSGASVELDLSSRNER